MKIVARFIVLLILLITLPYAYEIYNKRSFYHYLVNDANGSEVKLDQYKDKVVLVVNVASECGYTPQFLKLQQIYDRYKDKGFVVLGFPSNSFGSEPRNGKEILVFCNDTYLVDFPIFEKIAVKGEYQAPLYAFLTGEKTNSKFPGPIRWNFEKFLIDRKGKIMARFSSDVEPDHPALIEGIEKALDGR
ncbi:MAG: redoxin domain-containing protein [Candidatus Latescibacteria bacterium]|nr:redoxin domain-containing protein [Candidatus Latescibacterota bacterium]